MFWIEESSVLAPESSILPKALLILCTSDTILDSSFDKFSNCLKLPVPLPRESSIFSRLEITLDNFFSSILNLIVYSLPSTVSNLSWTCFISLSSFSTFDLISKSY